MRNWLIFIAVNCIVASIAAPVENEDILVIDKDFFQERLAIYKADYEISKIVVPINDLNFEDEISSTDSEVDSIDDITLFFVLVDKNSSGKTADKGLYILKGKNATKLLDFGTDIASDLGSKHVYFGAKEGLYIYDEKTNTAERYGNIKDSIIGLEKKNASDVLYMLTESNEFYEVTEEGTKKTLLKDIKNAREFVLDYSNNIFYVDTNGKVYIFNGQETIPITVPDNVTDVKLVRPPFVFESGVPAVLNKNVYLLHSNGSMSYLDIVLEDKPSAYGVEPAILNFYAKDKTIYEYNLVSIFLSEIFEQLRNYLDELKNEILNLGSQPMNHLLTNKV